MDVSTVLGAFGSNAAVATQLPASAAPAHAAAPPSESSSSGMTEPRTGAQAVIDDAPSSTPSAQREASKNLPARLAYAPSPAPPDSSRVHFDRSA